MVQRKTKTTVPLSPTDVVNALELLGVEISSVQGDEVYALCPLHYERVGKVDRKPSWSVNRKTGLHHCFSCGYSSTFVGLVMDVLKVDGIKATQWVKRNGLTLDIVDTLPDRWDRPPEKKRARMVPELVLQNFMEPPRKALRSRLVTMDAAEHYGVLWDDAAGAWILPIRWPDGLLVGYQWKKGPKVLNEPPRMRKAVTLFGIDSFTGRRAILVESPLDCLRLHSEGIEGGVSCFGSNVSEEQVRLLREYAETVVIALDNDAPGQRETRKLFRRLDRLLPTFIFNYEGCQPVDGKPGKDPGELVRASLYRGLSRAHPTLEG